MPLHQPQQNYLGSPDSLLAPFEVIHSDIRDTAAFATTVAVTSALRAASVSSAPNSKPTTHHQATLFNTFSSTRSARLPRSSSLLPPPLSLQVSRRKNDSDTALGPETAFPYSSAASLPVSSTLRHYPLPGRQLHPSSPLLPPPQLLPYQNGIFGEPLTSSITDDSYPDPSLSIQQYQMPSDTARDGQSPRSHTRQRSFKETSDADKSRLTKPPSQKAMLSRALQKANTAVQLDNAQNLEGARNAYSEACELLQLVLKRTVADEDKRKLESIRQTYASRIEEIDQMGPFNDTNVRSKALPARPGSEEYHIDSSHQQQGASNAATATPPDAGLWADGFNAKQHASHRSSPPPTRPIDLAESPPPFNIRSTDWHRTASNGQPGILQSSFSRPSTRSFHTPVGSQGRPADSASPLQSTRPASPLKSSATQRASPKGKSKHARNGSQNSWLDAVDGSRGSTSSSMLSRTSSQAPKRKHIQRASDNAEVEFDTALDAAIEAAYDDGYEPMGMDDEQDDGEEAVARVLRKVEMARERVRQTEQETFSLTNGTDMAALLPPWHCKPSTQTGFYEGNSSEDEERMLEEMTRDYGIGHFTDREAVPIMTNKDEERQPSTRHGELQKTSQPENIRPLMEKKSMPSIIKGLGPSLPPPNASLPELPSPHGTSPIQSVRNRRLSGQNPKQLKIDTTKPNPCPLAVHSQSEQSRTTRDAESERPSTAAGRIRAVSHARSTLSVDITSSDPSILASPGGHRIPVNSDEAIPVRPVSPTVGVKLRKNFSSSSLRSMKSRNMSLSHLEDTTDVSPGTPSSNQFGASKTPAVPTIPTPMSSEFRDNLDSSSTGARLFDDHFHQPISPGSVDSAHSDVPVPLEPCPNDFILRPFWLMRCLFQTLVHPRGGYVSTKLFVPREVWKVKGVKLRNIDEKIANCDLLTAALLKLAQVDTCDADAILEEMQSLEGMLEQIQASLTRRLGSEVGVHGSGAQFKEAGDSDSTAGVPRSSSMSNKASFSWRRLRSKSSGVGLSGIYNRTADMGKDLSMPSLPMTAQPINRPPRRDVGQSQFIGPNANYMSSLARLFDAAQAVDQIARQIDDPGLRHADKTQVGLELCTRHAAEFFSFYICRFVLADLSLLLEKFIKRGSEWVLA